MDSAPSIETVHQALQALYRSTPGDSGSHEKASQWLGEMQKSVYALQIADQLIQMNKNEESCYFGAQTIRTKIQFAFNELSAESHQSLRDSLLKHCTNINDETKNTIVTQLCLSLADLVVQTTAWKNVIAVLMQEFGSSRTHWAFLLEFLSVLPEELDNPELHLSDNRCNEVFDEMTNASPMLVQLLTAVMEAALNDSKTMERVMHCLGSWLSVYAIPQQHIVGSKLLHLPFAIMANHETPNVLHNAATECICNALIAVEDLSKNLLLAQMLFEGVTSLLEPYHMSVAIQDLEKSMNYCRVFTEMAETFLEPMIATPNQGFGDLRTIELLLTCIGHHQFEVADITFNFWNRLSEVLYDENKPEIIAVFQPYVQRLVIALCRLCQYENSQDGLPDEADDFDDFRVRTVDLVKDVEFVVGATNIVVQVFETLKGSGSGTPWEVAEAAIFIMAAVAKYIDLTEESAVPLVIQGVAGQQAGTHLAVLHSSMNLIGEFSKWINVHPQYLEPAMQFLLNGLHHPKLSKIMAESIQKLCSVCAEHMVAQFAGLLQVVQAVDTLNVTLSAGLGLLKACSLILSRLSTANISEGVRQLCSLQVDPLTKIISLGDVRVNRDEKQSDPSVWLDRLSVIFRHTAACSLEGKVHPCQDAILQVWPVLSKVFEKYGGDIRIVERCCRCVRYVIRCLGKTSTALVAPVLTQVWPVLSKVFEKYGGDIRIVERCCRCVRYVIRCLGKTSTALVAPVITQIVEQYQHHPHSCYLYLGSVLVDEYGLEPTCTTLLLSMLQALSTPTFKMLEEQDGLRNHPDTVKDLFRLTTRFIQTMPIAFLQSPIARSILLWGIDSVSIHHRDANESVTKYFLEFIRCTSEKPDSEDFATRRRLVVDLLKEFGQPLIHGLMKASQSNLPRSMISNAAEVFCELRLVDSPRKRMVTSAMDELNANSNNANPWFCPNCECLNSCTQDECFNCSASRAGSVDLLSLLIRMKDADPNVHIIYDMLLGCGPATFQDIENVIKMGEIEGKVIFKKVEAINNPDKSEEYDLKKIHMIKKNGPDSINERWLVHGTSHETAKKIAEFGFNRSHCDPKNASFGFGSYFAYIFGHSISFTSKGPHKHRVVILSKALCGHYARGKEGELEPPIIKSRDFVYDSTVDNVRTPTVHVIPFDNQSLAMYLVHFIVQKKEDD